MAAPLEMLLRALTSGNSAFTQDQLDYYGGKDKVLEMLHSFDPNASLREGSVSGGEGGDGPMGYILDYDASKAPKSKAGTLGLDLRSSNFGQVINPKGIVDDETYGSVTNSKNIAKPRDPLWTVLAPLAVATLAPMAGAALAGAGIGGAAGLTGAVTGSGVAGSAPGWIANLVKSPTTIGKLANGDVNSLTSLLPTIASVFGVNPMLTKGAMTLGQLARTRR